MGMTPNEAELVDVESHYPTDRIPIEMKEKSVAENLLEKMSETQWELLPTFFVLNVEQHLAQNVFGALEPEELNSELELCFAYSSLYSHLLKSVNTSTIWQMTEQI